MITDVTLPKLGVEMESAHLNEWTVSEGDLVNAGDVIANVETDKVVFDRPAPSAAALPLLPQEDEDSDVGAQMGAIAETDEEYASLLADAPPSSASGASPSHESSVMEVESSPRHESPVLAVPRAPSAPASAQAGATRAQLTSERRGGQPLASPVARRLAAAHDVDLATVAGTGRRGVIRLRDVEQSLATIPASSPAAASSITSPRATGSRQAATSSTVTRLSSMRRTIAKRMHASVQGTAQMTDIRQHDISELVALRERSTQHADRLGFRLSYTALFARAAIIALKAVPVLNASLRSDTELEYYESINIGMAVAIPDGLVVPVVHEADRLAIGELNEQLAAVIGRARDREASAAELSGGTFTITNFGSYGSHFGTPILMPPQVAILGIGAMLEQPVVRNGELAVGKALYTCLTVDHRVVDGEACGLFQNELALLFSQPELLLLG